MILGPDVVAALIIRTIIILASLFLPLLLSVCFLVYILIRRVSLRKTLRRNIAIALILMALTLIPPLLLESIINQGERYFVYTGVFACLAITTLWYKVAKKRLVPAVEGTLILTVFLYMCSALVGV